MVKGGVCEMPPFISIHLWWKVHKGRSCWDFQYGGSAYRSLGDILRFVGDIYTDI